MGNSRSKYLYSIRMIDVQNLHSTAERTMINSRKDNLERGKMILLRVGAEHGVLDELRSTVDSRLQ